MFVIIIMVTYFVSIIKGIIFQKNVVCFIVGDENLKFKFCRFKFWFFSKEAAVGSCEKCRLNFIPTVNKANIL